MNENKIHFRHILLYEFRKGTKAMIAMKNICDIYGESRISERTCRKWFKRFRDGNFDIEDDSRSGRHSKVNDDIILQAISKNRRMTVAEIAQTVEIPKTTVYDHMKKIGMINRYDVWVPHNLTEKNLKDRVSACTSLIVRNKTEPFLSRLVTGDEKWIMYNNVKRKRSWSLPGESVQTVAKDGLHPEKVMLCIWWDSKGVLFYELLEKKETMTADKYCTQLESLNAAIQRKRPSLINRRGVVFQQDNARPHVAIKTLQKLKEFEWDIIPHPPYSPDIAPSDYYLFRSLEHFIAGKSFKDSASIKMTLDQFFDSKTDKFYKGGIDQLPKRWEKITKQNGNYFIDFE